jgi:hypothetical protein
MAEGDEAAEADAEEGEEEEEEEEGNTGRGPSNKGRAVGGGNGATLLLRGWRPIGMVPAAGTWPHSEREREMGGEEREDGRRGEKDREKRRRRRRREEKKKRDRKSVV